MLKLMYLLRKTKLQVVNSYISMYCGITRLTDLWQKFREINGFTK